MMPKPSQIYRPRVSLHGIPEGFDTADFSCACCGEFSLDDVCARCEEELEAKSDYYRMMADSVREH